VLILYFNSSVVFVFGTTCSTTLYLVLRSKYAYTILALISLLFHFVIVWTEFLVTLRSLFQENNALDLEQYVPEFITYQAPDSAVTPVSVASLPTPPLASSLPIPISNLNSFKSVASDSGTPELHGLYLEHLNAVTADIQSIWAMQYPPVAYIMPLDSLLIMQVHLCKIVLQESSSIGELQCVLQDMLTACTLDSKAINDRFSVVKHESNDLFYMLWKIEAQACYAMSSLFCSWHYLLKGRIKGSSYLQKGAAALKTAETDLSEVSSSKTYSQQALQTIMGNIQEIIKLCKGYLFLVKLVVI
jgi:hypothetical protein